MSEKIRFQVLDDQEICFERINVILGANGTGKSTLINELKDRESTEFDGYKFIYVEGGRSITIENTLQKGGITNSGETLASAQSGYNLKRNKNLTSRVKDALILLYQKGESIKSRAHIRLKQYNEGGRTDESLLEIEDLPLEELFKLFEDIFPLIEIKFDESANNFRCSKDGGQQYPITKLSDGEKQTLVLLSEMLLTSGKTVFLVDEPELNLNTALACNLWERIERYLPDSIFIYTTHNIGFAMRPNVDTVTVLSNTAPKAISIEDVHDIDNEVLRDLLGTIPAILSANKVLVTEGTEQSFDPIVYNWLLDANDILVIPQENSENVTSIVERTGVWDKISTDITIIGVVDRDYKVEEVIERINEGKCAVTELYHLESYFCHPDITNEIISSKFEGEEVNKKSLDVKALIVNKFIEKMPSIILNKLYPNFRFRSSPTVPSREIEGITNKAQLETAFSKCISETKTHFDQKYEERIVEDAFNIEWEHYEEVKSKEDIEGMLKVLDSKELLNQIAQVLGFKSKTDYIDYVVDNFKPASFSILNSLKSKLGEQMQ